MSIDDIFNFKRGTVIEAASLNKLRSYFQNLLSSRINFSLLIGSGASLPAIELMGTTFNNLKHDVGDGTVTQKRQFKECFNKYLKLFSSSADIDNIEDYLSWLNSNLDANPNSKKYASVRSYVLKNFCKSISIDYRTAISRQVLDNYRRFFQGFGVSRQLLAMTKSPLYDIINVFTTNYDLFIEQALISSGYQYSDGFTNGIKNTFSTREFHQRPIDLEERFRDLYQPINPFFRLYKLHGSVNWICDADGVVCRKPCFYDDIKIDELPDNLMIMPSSSKYASTQGSPYSDLFREFVDILSEPNSILVTTGFGFGDQHITDLIQQALARTDFTLYAFISKRETGKHNPAQDFAESNSRPNAYFIYPNDMNACPHFRFSDMAEIFGPEEELLGILDGDSSAA